MSTTKSKVAYHLDRLAMRMLLDDITVEQAVAGLNLAIIRQAAVIQKREVEAAAKLLEPASKRQLLSLGHHGFIVPEGTKVTFATFKASMEAYGSHKECPIACSFGRQERGEESIEVEATKELVFA